MLMEWMMSCDSEAHKLPPSFLLIQASRTATYLCCFRVCIISKNSTFYENLSHSSIDELGAQYRKTRVKGGRSHLTSVCTVQDVGNVERWERRELYQALVVSTLVYWIEVKSEAHLLESALPPRVGASKLGRFRLAE